MPPSSPPTDHELLLCFVLPVLIVLLLALFPIVEDVGSWMMFLGAIVDWGHQQWSQIFRGSLPQLSAGHLLAPLFIGLPIGALVLVPALLVQGLRWGRWWQPATLWFWTTLYGFLPFAVGIWILDGEPDKPSLYLLSFAEITLGFAITVLAFRAWRRRRRAARAAHAADVFPGP